MKILHLLYESEGDSFGIGGVGMRAYEIYRRLKDRNEITLLCKKYPGAKDCERNGLRHVFAGTESTSLTRTLLSYAYEAARFVSKKGDEYDLIVEEFSPGVPTFLHAFTKRPVVLQVQGYTGALYFRKYNPLYASVLTIMEQLRPQFYDHFIFINRQTPERFLLNLRGQREIIPNGVSNDLLDMPFQEGEYVLYLGRIDLYGKGLDLLLSAYEKLSSWSSQPRLVVAGDGRDMEEFRTALLKLPEGVRNNVELTGWVSGDKKKEIIRRALFAVFPSRHEVQPIAVLEAMASGKPVVVSDIPEFSFVTSSGSGMSFTSGDAGSLAMSMKNLSEARQRSEFGLKGRERVREFTWDKVAEQYEKFLSSVSAQGE